ncbi:PIG-L deacetylase family protein [Chromobacterium haemolyticum]|uniref:PIG-L deacetylase family protein n=1 Tax=Chromobacterium haemolyticum TaxID=394935 RepID=UPI0009DB5611|nr:PIG-L deacetylase family protein [Chromobacterium haemolyticum]OQS42500.1 GlcNAc-PI de-N-acetylase [Chromobacterium haemolyticum]
MFTPEPKIIAVVAPHPDDETLGCGGTILKHVARGDRVHWIIFTSISTGQGFTEERVRSREDEIERVSKAYGFHDVHRFSFASMQLDQLPKSDLVGTLGGLIKKLGVQTLYVPYRNDAHSDHAAVFDACASCSKSFRYPSVTSVRVYETLSETEYGLKPEDPGFRPNLFIDIADFIDKKLEIMSFYAGEMAEFPFPRSEVTLRALSQLRGSQCGANAAEAFMLLKEIE